MRVSPRKTNRTVQDFTGVIRQKLRLDETNLARRCN